MARNRRPLAAALALFALTVPFGIATHLVSEFAGLGWHDGAVLLLSARHGYLGVFALLSLASLIAAVLRRGPGLRPPRVASLIDALPFGGRGPGFAAVAFVAQFGFFALTELGEGCPLSAGDVATGVVTAAIAAALGALTVTLCKQRILEFASALAWATVARALAEPLPGRLAAYRGPSAPSGRRTPFSFRYRPPPAAA
jgi:hypothetical protein